LNRFRFLCAAAALPLLIAVSPATLQAATTVKIISGNGQLIPPLGVVFQPMVVQVTNENNVPQASVTVNWTIVAGAANAALSAGSTTTTDSNGMTSNSFVFGGGIPTGSAFMRFGQNTITASTTDSSATFFLTELLTDPQGTILDPLTILPFPFLVELFAGASLTGQSGTIGSDTIQAAFQTLGIPIPNVGLQLVSLATPSTGPVVVCAENQGGPHIAMSDANGVVTCTPQFGGLPGKGQFYLLVGAGGIEPTDPSHPPDTAIVRGINSSLVVTAASPGSVKITQGNNQSATAGQALATQLQVEVDSSSGVPLSGQQVRWTANPGTAVNFSNQVTTTDSAGRTSVTATFTGSASGTVQVIATVVGTSFSQTFTLTAVPLITISGFTIVSGNNQSAPVGTAFPQPLIVQVTASSGSPANVRVQFQATGPVSISATSANTDSNGRAQVTATAGTVTGAASVTASIATGTGTSNQTFSLTVLPPAPAVTAANFVNAADQQSNSLSPCSIGSIVAGATVLGVANAAPTFPGQPAPTAARLTIGNLAAPILQIANNAIGQQVVQFQVPCEVAPGSSVPSTLNVGGGTTNINLNIQAASPGIFQSASADNVIRAVVVRPDGSFASPNNPARRGENVTIFATGLGATTPAVGTGSVPTSSTATTVQGTVIVGMAGSGVPLVSSKLSEDLPGVFLITFTIPSDIQTGNNVVLSMAVIPQGAQNAIYSGGVRIPVQ